MYDMINYGTRSFYWSRLHQQHANDESLHFIISFLFVIAYLPRLLADFIS